MSSEHLIIVARNTETGELRLPLGNTTLYMSGGIDAEGTASAESVLQTCRRSFTEDWVLAVYRPDGSFWSGSKSS